MPESPQTNLDKLETQARKIIEKLEGKNPQFKKEPVAFGIVALIVNFSMDESLPTDPFEEELREIAGVSSAETIDFRRAFG